MRLDLSIDINVTDGQAEVRQVEKIMLDGNIVYQIANLPEFTLFEGNQTSISEITLSYTIEDDGEGVTTIESSRDGGDTWVNTGKTALSDTIVFGDLETGNTYSFMLRVTNDVGQVVSEEIIVFLEGTFVAWSEDGETANVVPGTSDWEDPDTGDPIAGGNVRVREESGEKFIQLNPLVWNDGNGTFRGTRRLVHGDPPYDFFNLEPARTYELSIDWFFEPIWDWNTIGRDPDTIAALFKEHGRYDGQNKFTYNTLQEALDWVNDNLFTSNELTGENNPYFATGFPYQTGKMHGLSAYTDNDSPTGGTVPDSMLSNEWAVRCTWVKNTKSHPTKGDADGFTDIFVDGHNPDVPPKLALYIADQDTIANDESSRHVICDDFTTLSQNTWYTIKIYIQVNDAGKHNGIAKLTIIDRATQDELGTVYVDDLMLHNVQDESGYINHFLFNHFFGGGDAKYSPKINPDWESDVITNNGVYCRNDNYKITRYGALLPLVIESKEYTTSDLTITASHSIPIADIDGVDMLIVPEGQEYDSSLWENANFSVVNGKFEIVITDVDANTGDSVYIRINKDGRNGARSSEISIAFPTVPDAPQLTNLVELDQEIRFTINTPFDGNSPLTSYEFRINGGSIETLTDDDVLGSVELGEDLIFRKAGLVNGQTYDFDVRAVNAYGSSDWSTILDVMPTSTEVFFTGTSGIWTFEDEVRNIYMDDSGVVHGIPTYVAGEEGKGFEFSDSKWIDTGREDIGHGLHAESGVSWFLMYDFKANAGASGTQVARSISPYDGDRTFQTFLFEGQIGVSSREGNNTFVGNNLDDGFWHNIAIVWDGSSLTAYVDGSAGTVCSVGTAAENVGKNITFGSRDQDSPGYFFTGVLDNVIIGDFSITLEDITNIIDDKNNLFLAPYVKSLTAQAGVEQIIIEWEIV